jgi:hypothetical protein
LARQFAVPRLKPRAAGADDGRMRRILPLAALLAVLSPAPALADQVIPDDLIVQSSICTGFDCVNNESFSFDTLRLKENNTRIQFDDTSANAGFAANDWALQANETPSGGANRFMLVDDTAARTPFSVFAGAPEHALVVQSGGEVGLGLASPSAPLHVRRADGTAAFRVEETAAATDARVLGELVNNGPARLRFANSAPDAASWLVGGANASEFEIRAGGAAAPALTLAPGGSVRAGTVFTQVADPAAAAGAAPVNEEAMLVALRKLALKSSSYAADPDALRHVWPSADDFHAAFGLGAADGTIAPGDMAGVALAAVKALDARVSALPPGAQGPPGAPGSAGPAASKARVAKLEKRNKKLSKRLRVLERQVKRLARR